MKVMASKPWNNCLTKVNESLHPWMSSHHVDDGLGYLIRKLKDLHETMFTHTHKCLQEKISLVNINFCIQ
jgi:TFIIF-interacting CTD phosphatase-like protein